MNRTGFERKVVVLLFVLVLVVFSLAERDSRKLGKLYTTARLLQSPSPVAPHMASSLDAPAKNNR